MRFRNRVGQPGNTRVSFLEDGDDVEFVHVRHPLLLLARYLEKDPLTDVPWCSGTVPSNAVADATMLIWAIGSLEGYTNRVDLLCAAVDCAEGLAKPIPVEQAQQLLRSVSGGSGGALHGGIDVEALKTAGEEVLLEQFKGTSDAFVARDSLLYGEG